MPAADFSADELLYLPRNVRAHRLYGMSPVEQIARTVNIALRRDAATLDYYRTGSSPDAFATLPKEWTADQIRSVPGLFRRADERQSGAPAHDQVHARRLQAHRSPPAAAQGQYDQWLAHIICYAFSVPASPFCHKSTARRARPCACRRRRKGSRAAQILDQERARPRDPVMHERVRPRFRPTSATTPSTRCNRRRPSTSWCRRGSTGARRRAELRLGPVGDERKSHGIQRNSEPQNKKRTFS